MKTPVCNNRITEPLLIKQPAKVFVPYGKPTDRIDVLLTPRKHRIDVPDYHLLGKDIIELSKPRLDRY